MYGNNVRMLKVLNRLEFEFMTKILSTLKGVLAFLQRTYSVLFRHKNNKKTTFLSLTNLDPPKLLSTQIDNPLKFCHKIHSPTPSARTYSDQKIYSTPSKLKSAETWEKFPSGDDHSAPYPTWDFF